MTQKINCNKRVVCNVLAFLIIIILAVCNWEKADCLAIFGDEFGYWGNAASISGFNWNSLMSETLYYGFGYSLLIAPFLFIKNYILRYHLAILLNVVMVWLAFLCAEYIDYNIFGEKNWFRIAGESLISVLTISTITNLSVAWAESVVTLLMWGTVALLTSIVKEMKNWKIILLSVLLAYMVMVHQRNLPVVLLCILFCFIYFFENKKGKELIVFFVIFIIFYVSYKYLKNMQVSTIYSNSVASETNNYAISFSFLEEYLSSHLDGIKDFLVSLGAKGVILILSTGFTFLCAVRYALITLLKKEEDFKYKWVLLFIVLSGVSMTFLTAMQAQGIYRQDTVVYSRYFDFTVGPIILVGINSIEKSRKNLPYIALSALFCIVTLGKIYNYIFEAIGGFNYICSPLIGATLSWNDSHINNTDILIKIVIAITIAGALLLLYYCYNVKTWKRIVAFCIVFMIVIFSSNQVEEKVNGWRNYVSSEAFELNEILKETDKQIYYIYDEENVEYLNVLRELQYILADRQLVKVEDSFKNESNCDCYVISLYDNLGYNVLANTSRQNISIYEVKKR